VQTFPATHVVGPLLCFGKYFGRAFLYLLLTSFVRHIDPTVGLGQVRTAAMRRPELG
jgi:hypothetical protein